MKLCCLSDFTEWLGHAPDLWNNENNFLTIKLEVYVIFPKTLYACFFFPKPCSTRLSVPQCQVLCCWKYIWRKARWLANNIFSQSSFVLVLPMLLAYLLTVEDSCEYWGRKVEELNAWHFIKIQGDKSLLVHWNYISFLQSLWYHYLAWKFWPY